MQHLPHDNDPYITPAPITTRGEMRVVWAIGFLIVVILSFVAGRATAEEDWLCAYSESLLVYPNVSELQYDGVSREWVDLPSDNNENMPLLPINEEFRRFYKIEYSPSKHEVYLWPFWGDLELDGMHQFCKPLRIKLKDW